MKYSIEGFSQAKLLEYKLDVHDAYLLRWFSDFAATGGMKQTIKCGRVYFWVHYQTVIREFPVMGINNTRSISNRFEKYVKVGLLDKEIIKTNKGTYTFFAIIDRVFRALLYNPNNSYWDKKDSENGNIALPFLQTNENASANTHTNAHTCAKVH
ncbi:MAG: hypothetical protein R3Y36_01795, partial [Spirochaetales bacterium]